MFEAYIRTFEQHIRKKGLSDQAKLIGLYERDNNVTLDSLFVITIKRPPANFTI
jgi:hypothetical protein